MVAAIETLQSSLSVNGLSEYTRRQISLFFPDNINPDEKQFRDAVVESMERYAVCCAGISLKYYALDGQAHFNHLNTDQYATYLYFLSRALSKRDMPQIAAKIYGLNKALHAVDIFYEVELPDIFLLSHPVGTVLGRATYDNYFAVYQNCTVGSSGGDYPDIGSGVTLYKGAMVAGKCRIGANSIIAAHSFVKDEQTAPDSLIFGQSPNLSTKPLHGTVKTRVFGHQA